MENNYLNNMLKTARSKQVRRRMVALFSALVLILTTNQLKLKADTLERRAACGSVEHQHSEECHDEAGNIVCGLEEHIHTDACFQERPKADEVMPEAALPIEDGGLESGDDEFIVSSEIEIPPEESDSFELGEPEEPAPETDVEEETAAVESFVTPVYDFNGASYALLSDILARAGLDIDKNEIDEVGESVIDDNQQLSISVVKDEDEYTITALRDFIDDDMVELVVFTKDGGVHLVNLKNGIEYESAERAVDEEQPVPVEPAPVDDEDRTSAATTDDEDTADEPPVPVESAPVEGDEQTTVDATEQPSAPVEDEASEPVIEQTDSEAEATAAPTATPAPDPEPADEQSAADITSTATAEPINESITENRENEDSPQEAVEDEEQPGAAVEDEEQPEESVTEDEKQPEEDASDEAEEQPEEDASGEAEERPEESVSGEAEEHPDEASGTVYTATIDLTDRSAPFSLLEMMGAAAPAEELLVQEEQQAEEALDPSDWTLEYDEERLDVIFEDGDYLITPRASFEAATIFVGAGDSYVLNLVNYQLPMSYPAQSFEGITATMTVKVTADEGAFPVGTTMEVADVEDEATISDIAGAVEGENVTVNRVHAVDITFRDAEDREIEPLIPISVVMEVNEQTQSADAVVVHVDGEGNAEVLEQTGAGNEVAFDAEAFSVYAVVITERYISANGESYNIQVSYNSEAGIPDGAALRVEEVVDQEYLDMASAALGADKAVRLARFFDISIMADGGEIQPDGSVTVKVTLEDAVEADEVKAVHFGEDNVDVINVEEDSGTLSFQAESFSVYGIVYTVDFEFEGYTFSMPGGGRIWLTALLKALNADFSAANVRCISFSNPELVRLIPSIDGDNWLLMSLAPFNTEETLTLTLDGGRIVTIAVTDAEGDESESPVHDISGFLTRAEITDSTTGQVIGDSDGTLAKLHKSREYAIHLSFAEDEYGEQFPDEGTMKFFLPEAVDLPEGTVDPFSGSFDIDLGRGRTLTGNSVVLHHAVKDAEGKVTTPAYIEITWNAASSEYERLIASPRAAFNLNYYFTINTDYDELKFSDTISVPITEDPEYHVTINKRLHDADAGIVPYDNETGIATYQLEVQAEGKARDINVTDTLGKALDYVMDGSTVGVSVVYKNKNGGEPSRTYPDDNMTVTSGTGSDEQMIVHFNELADGDKAILTYQAKVDFTELTTQAQVKVDTTNTAKATAGNVTTEETTVSLEGHIQYLSVQKDTGTIDKRHEDDTDPYWLVPYKVVYNHERKVPVVDAVIKDEIYVGDIHAAAFYSDETHPFKVKVYKAGTTYSETTDSDGNITGWTFNGNNNAIATRTYQFSTDSEAAEPSVDEDGNTVPGTIVVTPSAVSDDLTDTPTSWTWTVPTIVDEDAGVTAATPLTYEITYYTKVSLGMVNEGQVGNRVTEDHSGDTSDAGHYVGTKPSNGLKVKKSVLDANPDGTKVDPAYTRWQISFDRTASNRTVVEDTLPRSENGSYADTYYVDADHPTLFDGLYDEEACVVNANNAGRVIFTFYKDTNKTQPGMKASDDSHQTITITFYTKNSEGWMTKTAEDGSVEQEHINRVRLIQNSTQAWNRATATPKEPKLVKTVEPAGTVYNRATGIYQPVFKYTLKLVGLDDTMFQNSELTITDEFDAFFTPVLSSTLAGDMSIGGDGKKDGVELPDYGYTGSVSSGEEVLKQTVPAGKEDKAIHVAISEATLNGTKKTITFTVDQYSKEGEGSHASDWNPWRKSETADDQTVYTGAPSYGYAYQMSYYLMINAEDMQKLAEKVYQDDESVTDPAAREGKVTLTNRAHVTDDVGFLHSEDIPVTIDVRPINKTRSYNSNSELATYTLTINAQKIRLNDGEPYIVKDEFDNLAVDYATISYVTDPEAARSQITHSYTGNVGTFMVPDQTKVTITYKAWPVGKKGDTVEMKNTATVMSYAAKKDESVTLRADHEGTAESYGVRVLKYSNDDMHKPLGRAVFQLLKMDENGNKVPVRYTLPSSKASPDEWSYVQNYVADGSQDKSAYPTPQNHKAGDPVFFITKDRNESVPVEQDETWGIAEVTLSQARDGVALSKGVRYYLREVETPEGHIRENTDWTFIIADNDDFTNYVYSNDSVLKISNPTQNNDLVVEKDFYDHTGLVPMKDVLDAEGNVIQKGQYSTEFEIIGKDDNGKVVYKKAMTYGNFKVVDEPQDDGSYVRKYKMIVAHDELPTGHYTVTERNYPEPANTVLTTTLDNPSEGVTLNGKVAKFDWTKGTSTGPLNIHFVNSYEDKVNTKVDVKVRKAWEGEGTHPSIESVSFDLYRTTDQAVSSLATGEALRDFVKQNNLLPVEANLRFTERTTTGAESTTTEYIWEQEKADKVSEAGEAYYYFVLERAVSGYEDQYTDSYAMFYPAKDATDTTQELTITNTRVAPTTSFTFGKLWAGPDDSKHFDTLVWPDGKTITVKVQRREAGSRANEADTKFELTYTIDKNAVSTANAAIAPKTYTGYATQDDAPKLTVLSGGGYNHYQFRLDGLPKYKAGDTTWQYFVTETDRPTDGAVAFDSPRYGYVDGIITAVADWSDAASREAPGSNQVALVESVINRAKPTVNIKIPVEKLIDGNVFKASAYDGLFSFELRKLAKVVNPTTHKTERQKVHVAYAKNISGQDVFTDSLDLTDGLTFHARRKQADGTYKDQPYFDGTYTYYVREVQPGEQNVELAEGQTEPAENQKQQAVNGVTFSRVEATIEYKVDFDWESGKIEIVRSTKYSDGRKSAATFTIEKAGDAVEEAEKVQFTNKYDEGKRPLTLCKLWDDDGNRDGLRGDVKFRVRAEADYTDAEGNPQTLKWPWAPQSDTSAQTGTGEETGSEQGQTHQPEELYAEIVMSVKAENTDARTSTADTLPVYIDSHPVTRYYIEEIKMPEGYTQVSHTDSPWVIDAQNNVDASGKPVAVEFTAENKHVITNLNKTVTLTKTWDDDSNRDNHRPTADTYKGKVYLYADGLGVIKTDASCMSVNVSEDTYTITIDKGYFTHKVFNAEKNAYEDVYDLTPISLPKYCDQGTEIVYTVIEAPIEHYTAASDGSPVTMKASDLGTTGEGADKNVTLARATSGMDTDEAVIRTLTNKHEVERTVKIELTKNWDDGENQDGIRPSRNTTNGEDSYLKYVTLYADGKAVFTNGAWITPVDDTPEYVVDVINSRTGTKDVALTGTGEKNTDYKVTFANLPVHKKRTNGTPIVYTLSEQQIGDYTLETNTNVGYNAQMPLTESALTIRNNRTPDTINVQATKNWESHGETAPDYSVTLRLVARIAEGQTAGTIVDLSGTSYADAAADKKLTQDGQTIIWANVPKYAPGMEGVRLAYYVEEVTRDDQQQITVPNGYHLVETNRVVDNTTGNITITVTNEYEETEITAKKKWDDDFNRDDLRQQVTFQLWRKIGNGSWAQVPSANVDATHLTPEGVRPATDDTNAIAVIPVDSSINIQAVKWSKLPAWIGNEKVEYDVREAPLPTENYTATDSWAVSTLKPVDAEIDAENELTTWQWTASETITNEHTPQTKSLQFTKRWDRKGYPNLPTDAEFRNKLHLWATYNDGTADQTVEVTEESASIAPDWKSNISFNNTSDEWSVTISGLPKYKTGLVGKEITYHISEDTVEHTVEHTTGDVVDKYTTTEHFKWVENVETKDEATPMRVGEGEILKNIHDTGSLEIKKTVVSDLAADYTRPFNFTVTTEPKISGRYTGLGYSQNEVTDHHLAEITFTDDGKATGLKLIAGETVTIPGLPTGVTYTVEEDVDTTNFNAPSIAYANDKQVLENQGDKVHADVTNTRKTNSLKISKTVVSALRKAEGGSVEDDYSHNFWYKVVLTGLSDLTTTPTQRTYTGEKVYANTTTTVDVAFTRSSDQYVAYIQLKHGETLTIKDLPYETGYMVTEVNGGTDAEAIADNAEKTYLDKFDKTSQGTDGHLGMETSDAKFTNTRKTLDLTVNKTFVADHRIHGDDMIPFTFEVTLTPPTGYVLDYTKIKQKAGSTESDLTFNSGVARVTVTESAPVTITGIPVDVTYSVKEVAPSTTAGSADDDFELPATVEQTGTVVVRYGKAADSADTTATDGKTSKSFQNDRKTGDLKVTKTVVSPVVSETEAKYYKINIELKTLRTNKPVTGTYTVDGSGVRLTETGTESTSVTFDSDGKAEVWLKNGQKVKLKDIPTGVTYTVTETAPANFTNAFAVSDDLGTYTENNPKTNPATGSIFASDTRKTAGAKVTNTRKLGNLTIGKTVDSPVAADHGDDKYYWFKVELDGSTVDTRLYNDPTVTDPYPVAYTAADGGLYFNNNVAYVKLKHGESVTAYGLPVGHTYKVTEITTAAEFADIPESIRGTGTTFDEDYAAKFDPFWEKTTVGSTEETPKGAGNVFTDAVNSENKFDVITESASTVRFTNTRKKGTLKLSKNVENPANFQSEKDAYYFLMVTLETEEGAQTEGGKVPVTGTYSAPYVARYHSVSGQTDTAVDRSVSFNASGEAVIPVQGNGESSYVEIIGLPIGVIYTVTEVTDDSQSTVTKNAGEDAFAPDNGYSDSVFDITYANSTGTIAENPVGTATVTNTRKVQPISLKKVSTETTLGTGLNESISGLSGAVFTLTGARVENNIWTADDTWSVTLKSIADGVFKVTATTGTLPEGTIATTDATALTLPVGCYLLTETHAPDGYNTLEYPVRVQVTPTDVIYKAYFGAEDDSHVWLHCNDTKGKTVQDKDDLTERDINLLIPNSPGAKLPSTGGPGTVLYTASGLSVIALALALLLRRKRDW